MAEQLGELEGMIDIGELTFLIQYNSNNDTRSFADDDGKVYLKFDNTNHALTSKNEIIGDLRIMRDHKSKTVHWTLSKNFNVLVEGDFQTRNMSVVDLDWHYLDIEDAEKQCFKSLVEKGIIKT